MRGGVGGAGKSSTTVHTASPGASWKKEGGMKESGYHMMKYLLVDLSRAERKNISFLVMTHARCCAWFITT